MECLICLNLSTEQRISPGPFIYVGTHWVVDHAYPTAYLGWLVILPKRHSEALHELTKGEFQQLAEIEYKLVQVMRTDPSVQKEYLVCFAEGEGFHHVHFHVVPKPADLRVGPTPPGREHEVGAIGEISVIKQGEHR